MELEDYTSLSEQLKVSITLSKTKPELAITKLFDIIKSGFLTFHSAYVSKIR